MEQLIANVASMRHELNERSSRHEQQDVRDFMDLKNVIRDMANSMQAKADRSDIERLEVLLGKKAEGLDFFVVRQDVEALNGDKNQRVGFIHAIRALWIVIAALAGILGYHIKIGK